MPSFFPMTSNTSSSQISVVVSHGQPSGAAPVMMHASSQNTSLATRQVSQGSDVCSLSLDLSSAGEPPLKKKRLISTPDTSGRSSSPRTPARKEALKTKMRTLVLPYIIQAVNHLPENKYRLDQIVIKAASIMAKGLLFRPQITDPSGLLKPEDGLATAARAAQIVQELTLQTEFCSTLNEGSTLKLQEETPEVKLADIQASTPASALIEPKPRTQRAYKPRIRRESPLPPTAQWMQLSDRPYLTFCDRNNIRQGIRKNAAGAGSLLTGPAVYHVGFSAAEIAQIGDHMSQYLSLPIPRTTVALKQLCMHYEIPSIVEGKLTGRSEQDVRNFCSDLLANQASGAYGSHVLSLQRGTTIPEEEHRRQADMSALLLAREIEGHRGLGRTRRYVHFQSSFRKLREDALSLVAEFTNCAGDISTMTWIPNENILCGTTTHSDSHNQQYNKPGNLLLCSTSQGTLRAFPDHRVPRPMVARGDNATAAMRRSQDPWIYSSVVSSDYDEITGLAYTSSFDRTIKAWRVRKDGSSMELLATFPHVGNVNFVAAAKDGSGRVAAAADAASDAIRIYTMDSNTVANSHYYSISCSRADADGSDEWAYCPATMQWGTVPGTQHLLLIGYSPRSFTGDDDDIPVDKQRSGEIMIWDALRHCRIPILTATTANVFEVAWHPTMHGFIVGTIPSGLHVEHGVRTQIHVFRQDLEQHPDGAFSEFQKLDCPAADINELTIMPNSINGSYVTAGCTDGTVYVWDTTQGDMPIHVLKHGSPLDEVRYDRECEDTGVKFIAWGSDLDRLYTGSSDGVVKVWNIRNKRKPFVRDLLRAPGPISCGRFSPDRERLAIGDATGRVFLFSLHAEEHLQKQFSMTLPGSGRRIHRPMPFTPHPEPPSPEASQYGDTRTADEDLDSATYARQKYLDTQQLTLHLNPVVGAVKGPNYAATNLFRREAHNNDDPNEPLVSQYKRLQQESRHRALGSAFFRPQRSLRRLRLPVEDGHVSDDKLAKQHSANIALDLDVLCTLEATELDELVREGALLNIDEEWDFTYEEVPSDALEGSATLV